MNRVTEREKERDIHTFLKRYQGKKTVKDTEGEKEKETDKETLVQKDIEKGLRRKRD